MKIAKLQKFMQVAEALSELSKDEETKVGCLILHPSDFSIISSGYNSFVRGAPDRSLPRTRPGKYKFIRHAEKSAICNAARNNGGLNGCISIQTLSPCSECMRDLYHCGVCTIYFKDKYKDFTLELEDINTQLTQVGKYYKLELSPKEN